MIRILVFILIVLFSSSCSEKLVNETPEEFGKSIISAINTGEFEEFRKYFVSLDECKDLFEKSEFETDTERESILSTLEGNYKSFISKSETEFSTLNFELLEYLECHYSKAVDGGVEFTKGYYIVATSGDTLKEIGFSRLVKTENGWKSLGQFKAK